MRDAESDLKLKCIHWTILSHAFFSIGIRLIFKSWMLKNCRIGTADSRIGTADSGASQTHLEDSLFPLQPNLPIPQQADELTCQLWFC